MKAELTFFYFEWSVILTDKSNRDYGPKRNINVYFINGIFDQLSHMKSGKLDFLSRILCVILDILSFCLLSYMYYML